MSPSEPVVPVREIALLSVSLFFIGAPFAAYVALAPAIEVEWALSASASAALYSAYLAGAVLAAALVLPRAPTGSPAVIRQATVLVAAAHLLTGVAPGPVSAGATRVVAGCAYIVVYYLAVQWIAGATPRAYRGRAIGAMVTASYAGTSASYLMVAGVLGRGLEWRVAYVLLSLPGLLGVVAGWSALRGAAAPHEGGAGAAPRSPKAAAAVNETGPPTDRRSLALVIGGYAAHTAELYVARFWIPYALVSTFAAGALSAAQAYLLSGLLFATGIAGPVAGGWVADRIGTGRCAAVVLLAGAALAGLLLSVDHAGLFVALCLVYCAILPADSAVLTAGVTLYAPAARLGRVQAVQAMAGFTAGAALPALVGVLIDAAQDVAPWRVGLATNAAIALMGAVLVLGVRRPSESLAAPSGGVPRRAR